MSSSKRLLDPSWNFFRCLETLQFDDQSPFMCRCLGLWKHWTNLDHLGPMMLFSSINRAILVDAGLPLSSKLQNSTLALDDDFSKLLTQFKSCRTDVIGIKLTRLLLGLGFYTDAKEIFNQIQYSRGQREILWLKYLSWMFLICSGSMINNSENIWLSIQELVPPYGPETILLCLVMFKKYKEQNIKTFIIRAIKASLLAEWEQRLSLARLYRIESEICEITGNYSAASEFLNQAILLVSDLDDIVKSDWEKQMCLETKRRILEYAYRCSVRLNNYHDALCFVKKMVELDPNCARANLFAGEISLKMGLNNDADEYLYQASVLGVLERPYANYLRTQYSTGEIQKHYFQQSICSAFFRKDADKILESSTFPSSMEFVDLQNNIYVSA